MKCSAFSRKGFYLKSNPCANKTSVSKHKGHVLCWLHKIEFDKKGKVILEPRNA